MIEGMKFHIKGTELSLLLANRSRWHRERAETLKTKNLKEAQDGMKAAASAAAAAGSVTGDLDVEVCLDSPIESMSLSYAGSPRRGHGGNMEDPVAAIKKAIVFHAERGAALDFYSGHLVNDATYVLTESDVQRFELIASAEQA